MNKSKLFAIACASLLGLAACTEEQVQEKMAAAYGGQTLAFFKPQGNGTSRVEVMLIAGANKPWTCDGTAKGEDLRRIEPQQVPLTCYGITRKGVANLSNDPRTGGLLVDYHLDGDLKGRILIN